VARASNPQRAAALSARREHRPPAHRRSSDRDVGPVEADGQADATEREGRRSNDPPASALGRIATRTENGHDRGVIALHQKVDRAREPPREGSAGIPPGEPVAGRVRGDAGVRHTKLAKDVAAETRTPTLVPSRHGFHVEIGAGVRTQPVWGQPSALRTVERLACGTCPRRVAAVLGDALTTRFGDGEIVGLLGDAVPECLEMAHPLQLRQVRAPGRLRNGRVLRA
jgi:hypothetical protein